MPLQSAKVSTQRWSDWVEVTSRAQCVSVYVWASVHTHALVCIFRFVGGEATRCMQYLTLPGQCVGFRALVEWFKLSRVKSLHAFHIQSSLCVPVYNFCVRFSKDVLWNDLLPHPESQASAHPHNGCVTPARFVKFSEMTSFAFFGSWREKNFILCDGVYMCARVCRCDPSPVFVDCRQVPTEKDNNRQKRALFIRLTDEIACWV